MNLPADAFLSVPAMIDEWDEFNLAADRIKLENLAPQVGDLLEATGGTENVP